MNKLVQYTIAVTIIVLMLGAYTVNSQTIIGGVVYVRSGPGESVTAPFTTPDGGVTTGSFSGLVELTVSGTGESSATRLNDAFWVFTDLSYNPITPSNDLTWYQLSVDTQTLVAYNHKHARPLVVYDLDADVEITQPYIPEYRPDHTYNIIIDLGAVVPASLHFGVSDGIFSDNSGQYNIMVYQLVPVDAWITGGGQIIAENEDVDNLKKNGQYEDYKISFGMGAYRIIDDGYLLDSCEVTFHNVSNNLIDKYKFVGETIHEMNFYGDGSVANCRISGYLEDDDEYVVDDSCYMWIRVQDSGEPAWEDNIRFQLLNAGAYNYDSSSPDDDSDFPDYPLGDFGTERTLTATGNLQVEDLTQLPQLVAK